MASDKLIADTNFLIDIFRFSLADELEDYDIFTVHGVVKELEMISKGRHKDSEYARLALKWLDRKGVTILETHETKTDDMLVDVATAEYVVGTDDKELRERLKSMGVKTIYVRARKKLAIT